AGEQQIPGREPHGILRVFGSIGDEARGVPKRNSWTALQLASGAALGVSSGGDGEPRSDVRAAHRSGAPSRVGTGLAGERLLLVVEFDVGLVEQGDVDAEREVTVGGFQKREARMPAVQVALEMNGVGAELPRVEIVVRIPGRRPMRRWLERQLKPHLLTPGAAAD